MENIKISKHITTQNSISLLPIFEIFPVHLQLTGRIYKNYQEINTSIKDYDDLLREIKELTISRNKSLEDKRTLFDNKRDNWNSIEVQDEVNALNVKIVDCDDKIRSKLTIVRNNRLENQYKDDKNISDAMRNILDWFERYPDIVKNITKA